MTRKPGEPLFIRGLDRWITREDPANDEEPRMETPEPSEEQQLLNRLFDQINILGGTNLVTDKFGEGYNTAISNVLELLIALGAQPKGERP